jgi:hypothetical protein
MRLDMKKLNRRSMLRQSSALAGTATPLLPLGLASAQGERPEPNRKLRVVAVGGHADDPQSCAGGTLALYADQGHHVVGLSLTGGPPPPPDANPEERRVKSRLDCMRMAQKNFYPTHYVDITAVEKRSRQAGMANTLGYPGVWPRHDMMRRMRGAEHG